MTKFDLADVRHFAADLTARMDRCDNGEGMECSNLDDTLRHYATLCCEYCEGVRQWGREVFAGRVAFNPEVEKTLKDEGEQLADRATEILSFAQFGQLPCYELEGQTVLQSAVVDLMMLLRPWVTPTLAVGPSARQGSVLGPSEIQAAQQRMDALPPLPSDWQPATTQQQNVYRKLKSS